MWDKTGQPICGGKFFQIAVRGQGSGVGVGKFPPVGGIKNLAEGVFWQVVGT